MSEAPYQPVAPPGEAMPSKDPIALSSAGFAIENFEQAWRLAQSMCQGGMVPNGIAKQPGAVIVFIQACAQLGIPLHVGLSNLTFTNGRFGIMGDLAHALVLRSGKLRKGTDVEVSYSGEPYTEGWTCTVKAWRADQDRPREPQSFSLGEAIRAGLCKLDKGTVQTHSRQGGGWGNHGAPWSAWTKRMLYYRALGFFLRDAFPDVLMGFYVQQELDDYQPEERDVTPAARPAHEGQGPAKADPLLALAAETAPELKIPEVMGREEPRELVGLRYQTKQASGEAVEQRSESAREPAQATEAGHSREVPEADSAPAPGPSPQEVIGGDRAKQDRLF